MNSTSNLCQLKLFMKIIVNKRKYFRIILPKRTIGSLCSLSLPSTTECMQTRMTLARLERMITPCGKWKDFLRVLQENCEDFMLIW